MTPAFDIEGGVVLAAARAMSVATLMLAFGSTMYTRRVAPKALGLETGRALWRLSAWSLCAAVLGGLVWLAAQSVDFADSLAPADIWDVLAHTMFGHLLAARLALLLLAAGLWAARLEAAAVCASGLAMVSQAGHSHGAAMGGPFWLVGAAGLHVLAAGAWLGALPALGLVVAGADRRIAHQAAVRFSTLGYGCVGVLLVTAAAQFSVLVIGLPGLLGTAYGWTVCAKMLGFAVLLVLAARNRFRLTPALEHDPAVCDQPPDKHARQNRERERDASRSNDSTRSHSALAGDAPARPKAALTRAIVLETGIGLLVVCAAGVLTELQPPMHIQALWPFGWLPSLEAAREDPDIAHEVFLYSVVLALGVALAIAAAILALRRRGILAGAAGLSGIAWAVLAAPHLSPLLVPAEPTIFYRSSTGFSAASIAAGKTLFAANCVACHGAQGRGDGRTPKTLPIPPADLTAAHLWMHADGQLFWWLAHGIENPEGGLAMPGFASTLSEDDRWALIDYIHANNAGLSAHPKGSWTMKLRAPDFALMCDGRTLNLSDLQGTQVQILFGGARPADALPHARTVVIGGTAAPQSCHADDPRAAAAYEAVTGAASGAVLVDAHGWLRQVAAEAAGLDAKAASRPMPAQDAMPMNMKM